MTTPAKRKELNDALRGKRSEKHADQRPKSEERSAGEQVREVIEELRRRRLESEND